MVYLGTAPWLVFWAPLCVCVLVIALRQWRSSVFGKFLAVGFSLHLVWGSLSQLWPDVTYHWGQVVFALPMYGNVLIALGIASFPTTEQPAAAQQNVPARQHARRRPVYKARSVPLTLVLVAVTLNMYWLFWLYHSVKELKQLRPNRLDFTPGQAIGFMFIPFFNLYWLIKVIIRFTQTVSELTRRYPDEQLGSSYRPAALSVLLLCAFALNSFAGLRRALPYMLLAELTILTVIGYTQRCINSIWGMSSAGRVRPVVEG